MRTTTVVIGAGHSGLAMSSCLSRRSIDHVVLERHEVANSWRTERWDSLRLLTPNWQCRLPGYSYDGSDPDGFMTMPEVVDFITDYATLIAAPVKSGTPVTSVRRSNGEYRVTTNQGEWQCADGRRRHRGLQCASCTAFCRRGAIVGGDPDPAGVPEPGATRRRRRARRRRIGDRGADRMRGPALRPPGDSRRRRACPRAPRVPGPGHPLVDGGGRRAR